MRHLLLAALFVTPALLAEIDEAVKGGFLWFQRGVTLRVSAGLPEQQVVWHLY